MNEPFDVFEYVRYLRRRWLLIGTACTVALLLSVGVSLLQPKRYTATASIVIEPPGSSDVRTATAVSPVYLESLRTYERFAASDSVFARAAQHFHLQDGTDSQSIESLKRRILKVSKLRDTKILEISATLPTGKLAQSFAEYLANETVWLSRHEQLASDQELVDDAKARMVEAQHRLEIVRNAWTKASREEPTVGLAAQIDGSAELISKFRKDLAEAETDLADYQAEEKAKVEGIDRQLLQMRIDGARARVAVLERRLADQEKQIGEQSTSLAQRSTNREALQMDLSFAESAYQTALDRLREIQTTAGTRSERLRVMDPGIVPQRPSSPNLPLNVIVALLLASMGAVIYLSLAFAFERRFAFRPTERLPRKTFAR